MATKLETFESYRRLLFSIAYRMLGSTMQAEDMVQEAYLRYEKVDDSTIQSPKSYLCTVATRLCLDELKSAKSKRETYIGTWLPEPLVTDDEAVEAADDYESISVAFLVLLESLTPIERAIFLLRDVFDYNYTEIALMVDKSEANCRRYYQHAKQYVTEHRPRFEAKPDNQRKMVETFLHAIASGDVDSMTRMLAEDITLYGDGGGKAPAVRQPLVGREAVLKLMSGITYQLSRHNIDIEVMEINGASALLFWEGDKLHFVMNFTVTDDHITTIHNMLNPDKLVGLHRQG